MVGLEEIFVSSSMAVGLLLSVCVCVHITMSKDNLLREREGKQERTNKYKNMGGLSTSPAKSKGTGQCNHENSVYIYIYT